MATIRLNMLRIPWIPLPLPLPLPLVLQLILACYQAYLNVNIDAVKAQAFAIGPSLYEYEFMFENSVTIKLLRIPIFTRELIHQIELEWFPY